MPKILSNPAANINPPSTPYAAPFSPKPNERIAAVALNATPKPAEKRFGGPATGR